MDLSISILNFNNKNLVKQCIKNIVKSNPELEYEIIITDNRSTDGSVEMIQKQILPCYKNTRLIKSQKNRGFGAGHNLGLSTSNAQYVMVINPDIVILKNAITDLYSFINKNKNIGIVGPRLLYPDLSLQKSCHAWPKMITPLYRRTPLGKTRFGKKEISRYNLLDMDGIQPTKVNWMFGACLLFRKKAWDEIQGFDENFFLYCEDIDICRRCWNSKWEVWHVPKAKMIHYHKRLSAKKKWWQALFDKSTRIHVKSHLYYFKKHKKLTS